MINRCVYLKLPIIYQYFVPFYYRFFTGDNVWSAYVNITKCRIKSDTLNPGQFGGGLRGRGSRAGQGQRADMMREACPLRISVAPRRPPNYMDPKTRYCRISLQSYICMFPFLYIYFVNT